MKVLITGASGFTGRFMMEYLEGQKNLELFCLSRKDFQETRKETTWISCDLRDEVEVDRVIHDIVPDRIIHLAGLNSGPMKELIETNIIGTDNLLNAIHSFHEQCRTLVIGSSAEYGFSKDKPIKEDTFLNPVGAYGVSKVAQDLLARSYFHRDGIQVAVARPFNLIGPGQGSSYVCGRIISQVVEIENKMRKTIDLHEIKSSRDFLDVRDAVKAYWSILDHDLFSDICAGNAINVGSGKSYSIAQVLEIIWKILGKKFPVALSKRPEKILVPYQQSDNSFITSAIGWIPKIELEESLKDMLITQRTLKDEIVQLIPDIL